jgi:hypothetical protein
MEERQWLDSADPLPLLRWLVDRAIAAGREGVVPRDRKLRLWGCACVRLTWLHLSPESRRGVEFIEAYADGRDGEEWQKQLRLARSAYERAGEPDNHPAAEALNLYWDAHNLPASVESVSEGTQGHGADPARQVRVVRCVFGNPFRLVTIDPSWSSPEVRSLAEAAYQDRVLPQGTLDDARVSILADALEDAGCAEQGVLDHLREGGPHVRGCFVVDLLRG